eukprot:7358426-Pyramimonas_sp.AAC.1
MAEKGPELSWAPAAGVDQLHNVLQACPAAAGRARTPFTAESLWGGCRSLGPSLLPVYLVSGLDCLISIAILTL